MDVIAEEWLCVDCMIYAVNGDLTGIHGEGRCKAVEDGVCRLQEESGNLSSNFDTETGEGFEEFSNRGCDACKSPLAGSFYRFAVMGDGDYDEDGDDD